MRIVINRVGLCKRNVSNDEISQILVIFAHYGEPAIVNSAQRFRQDKHIWCGVPRIELR